MNELMSRIIAGSDFGKGLFLMAVGLAFVFAVQMLFYGLIKFACRRYNPRAAVK